MSACPASRAPGPLTPSSPGLVHGMERDELAVADWPALRDDEVREVLSRLGPTSTTVDPLEIRVQWCSPRPMSAAALVRRGETEMFVKRHHVAVRGQERLRVEHEFAGHLRRRGQRVARVLAGTDGDTVFREGDFVYEVQEKAPGLDLYREQPSWYPFFSRTHARSAGRVLARLHEAARDFAAPASAPGVLTNSTDVIASLDPLAALGRLVSSRPGLARSLASRDVTSDVARHLAAPMEEAAASLRDVPTQWGHGDWHPSNLTWTSTGARAQVASVFDLALANRTSAVHDLAIALERSAVDWLDLDHDGVVRADLHMVDALLDGYESVRPLDAGERHALVTVLPVAHVEFALSEVEYFADVVHSAANTDLAYDGYLIGHARWFTQEPGERLLAHLRRRA